MNKQLALFTVLILLISSCRLAKFGQFYLSKNHQKPSYPHQAITHNPNQVFTFASVNQQTQALIGNLPYTPKKGAGTTLDEYLNKETKTTAFLVIRRDTLLFEKYYDGFSDTSLLPSFSVAKSFTSALMGITIQEKHIQSVQDLVIDYLPELKAAHPYWSEMTVEHLLNMRSGIQFNEDSYVNPYSSIANLYMTKDIFKQAQKAKFAHHPGTTHYYSSLDTSILGLLIERATNKSLAQYLTEKIWQPCGMESSGEWDMDSQKAHHTKAYCCLNITARDYAKFGRLFLKKGNWEGKQIINEAWVNQSITPNFNNGCYQYQWYSALNGYEAKKISDTQYELYHYPDSLAAVKAITNPIHQGAVLHWEDKNKWVIKKCGPAFSAIGIFGQEIYVNPETEIIAVRLGQKWDMSNDRVFRMIERVLEEHKF